MRFSFDTAAIRQEFPGLARQVNGHAAIFLDGPGGSQVPKCVADKIYDYLLYKNANAHGVFATSLETMEIVSRGREALADFFGCDPDEVCFGESTTGNNFKLAMAMARDLSPGDEVIITSIDHEGNRSPWKFLAEFGCVIHNVKTDPVTCTLSYDDFVQKLSPRTKIVAINWASNGCGTVTDVKKFIAKAHEFGAFTIVDAVHYAPHKPMDVREIDTDFLVCSAYKFFGPHLGVLYAKRTAMERLCTIRVDADDNMEAPEKFETGTPNFEHIAGTAEAIDFIARIGAQYAAHFPDQLAGKTGRRRNVLAGMLAFDEYESMLETRLRQGLSALPGLTVYAVPEGEEKTSTISFTVEGKQAVEVAKFLAERGIFVWDGDFYAISLVHEVLKLTDVGGLVRIGLEPYITMEEIERTIAAMAEFCDR